MPSIRLLSGAARRVVLGLLVLTAAPLAAQSGSASGVLAGTVLDSTGTGIIGAEVSIVGSSLRVLSDQRGAFRLTGVPAGEATVRVRRLGFRPVERRARVAPDAPATLDVTLAAVPREMEAVVVRGDRPRYVGPLAGFYRRRDSHGGGRYFTWEDIARLDPHYVTDIMRRIPGVRVSSPGIGPQRVRLRAARGFARDCPPFVWVDGQPLGAAEFDVDALNVDTIEGIEVYSGISSVPAQFMGVRGEGSCGVIVFWTGYGERRKLERASRPSPVNLDSLVTALRVYTAEQVDTPVRPDTARPVSALFPDELLRAGTDGEVVAEFVVSAEGLVEMETFGIVSATHPLFAAAVYQAIDDARFHPAVLDGRRVRQVVQLPVHFERGEVAAGR